MKQRILPLLAALAAAPVAFSAEWLDSLPAAQQAAAEQGKDVLILYRGDEFERSKNNPAPHFHSSLYTDKASERYVLVEQQAPLYTNDEGKQTRSTAVVFTDASGRPYYLYRNEWENGMDWAHEELAIASERKPHVSLVWEQMDARPEGTPATTFAHPLFDAMPLGIEFYYAPYGELYKAAMENEPAFRTAMEERKALAGQCARMYREIIVSMGSQAGMQRIVNMDFGFTEEEWRAMPAVYQSLYLLSQYVLWGAQTADAISSAAQDEAARDRLSVESLGLKALLLRSVRIAPRSKMARMLRVCGFPQLDTIALALRSRCYHEDAARALAYVDETEAQAQHSCQARQFCALVRGRVLVEQLRWEEAEAELLRAEKLDPGSSNAINAREFLLFITENRAELQALAERRLSGDEQAGKEWKERVRVTLTYGFAFRSADDHLWYESDASVAAMEALAQQAEAEPDKAGAEQAMSKLAANLSLSFGSVKAANSSDDDREKLLARAEAGGLEEQKLAYIMYMAKGKEWYSQAVPWLRKAAAQGDRDAQYMLAQHYRKGEGTDLDESAAVHWVRQAAEQGHDAAQAEMAVRCINGEGVPADHAAAESWLLKAAAQENVSAQSNLAVFYHNGMGAQGIDMEKAVYWAEKAAQQGDARSQFMLGVLYYYGDKVEEDLMKAEFWLNKAAEQGHADAKKLLQIIRNAADPFLNGLLEQGE